MKHLSLALALAIALATTAHADAEFFEKKQDKLVAIDKVTAIKTLINQPAATIVRCNEVELTSKATLRNK